MNKGKLLSILSISIIFLLTLTIVIGVSAKDNAPEYNEVIVYSGDTLWDIAAEISNNQVDVRKIIKEIRTLNELNDATIYEGQVLLVPII